MRIEEIQENLMIKSTDSVEKYLLNIIQEYFKDHNETIDGTKEDIINEAVNRLKSEMDYNSLGVLSIAIPNGEVRKGDVTLTCEDLDAEPLIESKGSAFNVNFGTEQNTACEGNDPRLSDARRPLEHNHETSDVRGLDGILSTINGQISRVDTFEHDHSNKDVLDLITYTGQEDHIDLSIIDNLESKIDNVTDQINDNINNYTQDTRDRISELNGNITTVSRELDEIHNFVIEQINSKVEETKTYIDQTCQDALNNAIQEMENNYINKSEVTALIDTARRCYTLVNTEKWDFRATWLDKDQDDNTAIVHFSNRTIERLQEREVISGDSSDIIFETYIEFERDGKVIRQQFPLIDNFNEGSNKERFIYPSMLGYSIDGYVDAIQRNNDGLIITFNDDLQHFIDVNNDVVTFRNGKIVCDIYAKENY